jgi:hypothetical protein
MRVTSCSQLLFATKILHADGAPRRAHDASGEQHRGTVVDATLLSLALQGYQIHRYSPAFDSLLSKALMNDKAHHYSPSSAGIF